MRWREGRRSTNIEDRRGGGGGFGIPLGPGIGGGGALAILVLALLFGVNPAVVLGPDTGPAISSGRSTGQDAEQADFVAAVLADTEDTWGPIFQGLERTYQDPVLVLYSGSVSSACGFAQSAVGPFYCPGDHKVYLDLGFFRELQERFRAPGDFAQAYVIAHEIGHHVQTLLGITERVDAARARGAPGEGESSLSVRMELQADCFAGVWASQTNRMRHNIEPGDIDEALGAASAVGDDTLQRAARGRVVPDSFTHGTSAQRTRWFRRGFDAGSIDACDTFAAERL